MTDKFANLPKRIRQCLVVAFSPSSADGERAKALREFDQYLTNIGSDGYELIERIATPPVSDEEMRRVFEAGRASERQHNAGASTPKPSPGSAVSYTFEDRDRVEADDTHNGYTMGEIAAHCATNLSRIPGRHHGFCEDMFNRLTGYDTISGAQAKYLASLFRQYFSGKI